MMQRLKGILIGIGLMLFVGYMSTSLAQDVRSMTHDEFVNLLFDQFRLGGQNESWQVGEKITVLRVQGLQPSGGYLPGKPITYGEFAEVLVKVYGFQYKMAENYSPSDAIAQLANEKILSEQPAAETPVSYEIGSQVIRNIPVETDNIMRHEEFVHHLFDKLELVERDVVLSVNQKIEALTELNLQPREGYRLEKTLRFGELGVVFIKVFGLETKLKPGYLEADALDLLMDENIFQKWYIPVAEVTTAEGVKLINNIPRVPQYKQRTVLLPRWVREDDMSRCE